LKVTFAFAIRHYARNFAKRELPCGKLAPFLSNVSYFR
jgi:hypothetical protein